VVPYYNKPTQEGQYRHFRKIAETVDLPMILYNVPARTVADLQNDTVMRWRRCRASSASRSDRQHRARHRPHQVRAAQFRDLQRRGCHGARADPARRPRRDFVTANVAPKLMRRCARALVAT